MNLSKVILIPVMGVLMGGCAMTPSRDTSLSQFGMLSPKLSSPVAIIVHDKRPSVETEKKPSTEYLYSGALFAVEGNESIITEDIANILIQYRGANRVVPAEKVPANGVAIVFDLTHWYSRAPLNPKKGLVPVTGEFGGKVTFYRDGKIVAEDVVTAQGIPTMVDTYIVFEREKKQTPKLIWDGMLNTANSSQQNGYVALYKVLQSNWNLLGQNINTEQIK